MEDKLLEFLIEEFMLDEYDLDVYTDLLNLCIFDYVEFFGIISAIEDKFSVKLLEDDFDDIEHLRTIKKINTFIEEMELN